MNAKKAPVPNAANVATVQGAENQSAATGTQQLNQTNQVSPLGSTTYSQSAGPNGLPQYTVTQNLSPQEQALLAQQQGVQGQANTLASSTLANTQPLDLSNPTIMNALAATYSPLFNQQQAINQEALNSQLNNEGLHTGDTGYQNAQQTFGLTQADAWNNILQNAYGQQVASAEAAYQLPIQGASSLASLGAAQFPSQISTPQNQIQPVNTSADVYNSAQIQAQNVAAQNAQNQAMMGGLFGLGSAAITGGLNYARPVAQNNYIAPFQTTTSTG